MLTIVFLVCFVLGLVISVLSVFTGGLHLHGTHLHLGTHGHGGVRAGLHAAGGGNRSPLLNSFTLPAFLCWFGGCGYLLHTHTGLAWPLVLLLAVVSGSAGAALLFLFLTRILLPHDRPLTAEETQVVGAVGVLTTSLAPGAVGEMQYTQMGARRAVAVRPAEGAAAMARGTEVFVVRYERGVAHVLPMEEALRGGEQRDTQHRMT